MKKNVKRAKKSSLPPKHIAILFEGTWFFRPDPTPGREGKILAMCPYVIAPDHVCDVGFWNGEKLVSANGGAAGTMNEGDTFVVDVDTGTPRSENFSSLFKTAHEKYHFPYLTSTDPKVGLRIPRKDGMRAVSFTMPDLLLVGGELKGVTVKPGKSGYEGITHTLTGKPTRSYVTFIMVYKYSTEASVSLSDGFLQQTLPLLETAKVNPHLIFKVRGNSPTDDGCVTDCSHEITHIVSTFDSLRRLAFQVKPKGDPTCCDIGIYLPAGQPLDPLCGDTLLTPEELGLGIPKTSKVFRGGKGVKDLASCATGPFGGDPGALPPPPGPMAKGKKKGK